MPNNPTPSFMLQQKSAIGEWVDWIEFFIQKDAIHELATRQTHYPFIEWRIKPTTQPT